MAKKHAKPKYMRMNLRSRKAIAQWLLDAGLEAYDRHDEKRYIFGFDCEDHSADFSYENLLKVYLESGEAGDEGRDPVWLGHCRRHYAEKFCGFDPNEYETEEEANEALDALDLDVGDHDDHTLYEYANEDMQRLFGTDTKSGVPDDDLWNTLWDGSSVSVEFGYVDRGYADNTLCLLSFEGHACTEDDLGKRLKIDAEGLKPDVTVKKRGPYGTYWETTERGYDPDETGPLPWTELKRLYEYVQTLKHFFVKDPNEEFAHGHTNGYVQEMEYQAAWSFFNNSCERENFPNPTAEKKRRELFFNELTRRRTRKIGNHGEFNYVERLPRRRRRLTLDGGDTEAAERADVPVVRRKRRLTFFDRARPNRVARINPDG
jgi:hypothetical protein